MGSAARMIARPGWSRERIEKQRNASEGDSYALGLLEAACLLYLDARDRVLCALSCEDGEWTPDLNRKPIKHLRMLGSMLTGYAENIASDEYEVNGLIWGLLDKIAIEQGYTLEVNWSLYSKDPGFRIANSECVSSRPG